MAHPPHRPVAPLLLAVHGRLKGALRGVVAGFGQEQIDALARVEAVTRHDVKAVEYFVRDRLEELGLAHVAELTHFACTSEDINNLSSALVIDRAVREVWLPKLVSVIGARRERALLFRDDAMLSRTHGQPATPTTLGKELAVFVHRLERLRADVEDVEVLGKFSGATGTFAAHLAADADVDWPAESRAFVTSLGLVWNPLTTQIESHDWQAELYTRIAHVNRVLHNLCTDVWTYISMGYFRQIPQAGATGSSTMPHKSNPIRFENAEANLELSHALLDSLASTLVTSRLQRDLTDSTTQRKSASRSGTRCWRSTTSGAGSSRSTSAGRCSRPTSTPTGRSTARPSRRSSAPRSSRGAAPSATRTRCSRSSRAASAWAATRCGRSSPGSTSGTRRRRDCSS